MPPKAEKKPTTAGKAPAGKAPAEKKEAGKKTAAPSGEKKKRSKTRKETYSSYIYKGTLLLFWCCLSCLNVVLVMFDPFAWVEACYEPCLRVLSKAGQDIESPIHIQHGSSSCLDVTTCWYESWASIRRCWHAFNLSRLSLWKLRQGWATLSQGQFLTWVIIIHQRWDMISMHPSNIHLQLVIFNLLFHFPHFYESKS